VECRSTPTKTNPPTLSAIGETGLMRYSLAYRSWKEQFDHHIALNLDHAVIN
jgi:hypothetical protein